MGVQRLNRSGHDGIAAVRFTSGNADTD